MCIKIKCEENGRNDNNETLTYTFKLALIYLLLNSSLIEVKLISA